MKLIITSGWFLIFSSTVSSQPAIEWEKSLGGSNDEYVNSVEQTTDGGYILAGGTYSNNGDVTGYHGFYDSWVVKLDNSGIIQWEKCLGGTDPDAGESIEQTNDGGYIVAASSSSNNCDVTGNHGWNDYWIVKLDSLGNIQWQKSLGGSNDEYVHSIHQTIDGGYVVAGSSNSNDGDVTGNHNSEDYWIVKLDSTGNIQWEKSLGGTYGDKAYDIQQTSDTGYIVVGASGSNDGDVSGNHGDGDYWIVKLDNSGNIEWQKCFGGTSGEEAYSVQLTSDKGFVVAGYSWSSDGDATSNHGWDDYWIIKLDSSGNIQWQKSVGGTYTEDAYSIQQTNDGGFIVAGTSDSNDGDVTGWHVSYDDFGDPLPDYWIIRLDSSGNLIWEKCLGGSDWESAFCVKQTTDEGYIIAGSSSSDDGDITENHGKSDYWIIKLAGIATSSENTIPKNCSLFVFPNPAKDQVAITISDISSKRIEIRNSIGKIVYSQNNQLQNRIDISRFVPGIYLLYAINENVIAEATKFIKQE
ncbi:MAG: T9SS type A sorting domain-containing protein [Bacteroidetes bacterium]|nr:T9SS type A sorting domain-containing protein [Bacteroidota bacterium]